MGYEMNVIMIVAAFVFVGAAFVAFIVASQLLREGKSVIRMAREEGGGIREMFSGKVRGGQSSGSLARGHGLYMAVDIDGNVAMDPKSMIAR